MKRNSYTKLFSNLLYFFLILSLGGIITSRKLQAQDIDSLTTVNVKQDSLIKTDSLSVDTMISPDALKSKVSYKATDSIRIDMQKQLVYLFGKAEVYYENIVLKAEEIEISMDSSIVTARGKQDSTGKYFGEP
ncbi:MAG: hypothetical protein P1U41_08840, partial [Vicingaceae bacterium]|nr:hypothetical protein [Vicingaceae bacterium]